MQDHTNAYILSFQCPDRLGVVARYSGLMYESGAYITEQSNYSDPVTDRFFLRAVFDDRELQVPMAEVVEKLAVLAKELDMQYELRDAARRPRVLLAVSRYDHCLSALLTKWKSGALPVQHDALLAVQSHGLRQGPRLDVVTHVNHLRHRDLVVDGPYLLDNDRPLIEICGHVVRGRADHLDPPFVSLVIGTRALEAGKEGMMDVDRPAPKLPAQLIGKDLHVARQHQ
jgi:hypothetical protein